MTSGIRTKHDTVAVLPVKSFDRAKQRLADALAPDDRAALAERMVSQVLNALSQAQLPTIVVTADERAKELARETGARVVHDPDEAGQSHAALLGIAAAPADRVLLVPGDCPAITATEIIALLGHEADVVIVPDRHGSGTNALLLTPPDVIVPSFGPGSFVRHAARARAAGAAVAVARLAALEHDVDTPEDLDALQALLPT